MKRILLILLWPCLAFAANPPDLPPTALVEKALHEYPLVKAAVADVQAGEAQLDRLNAGPYEFALRLASQRRHDRPLGQSYGEHEIGIERPIRLPGKAAKDAELGAAGIEQARFALGDAIHESARLLLERWFQWQREAAATNDWVAQVELLRRQHEVVNKRVSAGDAAKLEALLSGAQLAHAEAQLAQSQSQRERAAIEFAQHFPAILLPEQIRLSVPQPVQGTLEQWRESILAQNHEVKMARAATQRRLLEAQRLDAERLPDPTLGLSVGTERNGQERIIGVQVAIPLPGSGRAAATRAGLAETAAASAREAHVLARVEAEARRTVSMAQSTYDQWQRLADVAKLMEENVRLLDKAWRLGEGQFAELQSARRQMMEARLAATQAQLEANEANYRLLLDAHQLWPLDDGN